jgi:hypothetical protein
MTNKVIVDRSGNTGQRQIEQEARRLYNECQTVKPDWGQLGEATKSLWMERVK